MKALLLVAHGSQRKQSNDEVVELAGKLRKNHSHHFAIVNAAFLEAADVLIPEGIRQCVDEGATAIVVLPYFLNSGKHVVEDIPAIVNSCKGRYTGIAISIAPHIGASPLMLDIILASADRAENPWKQAGKRADYVQCTLDHGESIMPRVELNTHAPEFTLSDFNGQSVSLSDFTGRKNVLLVFNRGFAWPFCRRHMAQLRRDYQRFVERAIEIVAIGPDNADAFRNYWKKKSLPFIGLPDPEHSVLKLYGQEVRLLKLGRMPAQMLIDTNGALRYVHYARSMADIPPNADILNLIKL